MWIESDKRMEAAGIELNLVLTACNLLIRNSHETHKTRTRFVPRTPWEELLHCGRQDARVQSGHAERAQPDATHECFDELESREFRAGYRHERRAIVQVQLRLAF